MTACYFDSLAVPRLAYERGQRSDALAGFVDASSLSLAVACPTLSSLVHSHYSSSVGSLEQWTAVLSVWSVVSVIPCFSLFQSGQFFRSGSVSTRRGTLQRKQSSSQVLCCCLLSGYWSVCRAHLHSLQLAQLDTAPQR